MIAEFLTANLLINKIGHHPETWREQRKNGSQPILVNQIMSPGTNQ